jgi:hypothetical protein
MVTPIFLKTIPIPQPLVLEAGRFDEFFASRIRAATRWKKKNTENPGKPDHIEYLVGGSEHEFYFPFHIWVAILPIDELIFLRWLKPLTRYWFNIIGWILD